MVQMSASSFPTRGLITPSVDVSTLIERILDCTQNRKIWLHVSSIIMNSIQEYRKSLDLLIMSSSLG